MPAQFGRRATLLGGAAALAGCATPAAPPSGPTQLVTDGTGYVILQAPINPQTQRFLGTDFDRLVAAGATKIVLGIESPGGVIVSAEAIIAAMDRLHDERGIRFVTYNLGVVASAACYVFLAGQERYAAPRSAFLFHQASVTSSGPMTGQALQEASAQMAEHERVFSRMLRTRTRLTEGDVASFLKRTVILSPDEARRDGITTGTAPFTIPKGTTVMRIATRPANGTANPSAPATTAPPIGGR